MTQPIDPINKYINVNPIKKKKYINVKKKKRNFPPINYSNPTNGSTPDAKIERSSQKTQIKISNSDYPT